MNVVVIYLFTLDQKRKDTVSDDDYGKGGPVL